MERNWHNRFRSNGSFVYSSLYNSFIISLRINNRLRRTDLLNALFEKFFYESKYAEIRKHIGYSSKHEDLMKLLEEALINRNKEELEEKCVDFFNFFEFIAVFMETKAVANKRNKIYV